MIVVDVRVAGASGVVDDIGLGVDKSGVEGPFDARDDKYAVTVTFWFKTKAEAKAWVKKVKAGA